MGTKQNSGFTIIEVSLFLAVSGMLIVGLIGGIALSIQRQRFTDSMNSTQSFLQSQFNETEYTLNNRDQAPCSSGQVGQPSGNSFLGASECLVIGKLIDLGLPATDQNESTISVYDVLANAQPPDNYTDITAFPSTLSLLKSPQMGVTAQFNSKNKQDFLVPWGAQIKKVVRDEDDTPANKNRVDTSKSIRYIALLRSLIDGTTGVYKVDSLNLTPDSNGSVALGSLLSQAYNTHLCIASQDAIQFKGAVTIIPISSQDSITTDIDGSEGGRKWC